MKQLPSRLLVVTDRKLAKRPLERVVSDALKGGARWIWFRDRDLSRGERQTLARRLLGMCREAGAVLTVGGEAEDAIEMAASACHLPAGSDPRAARAAMGAASFVGVSAHSTEEAVRAGSLGADYVTLSPIFETASKPGYGPALGASALASAPLIGVPVVALGGVSLDKARECLTAGAAGIAVMGAIMTAPSAEDMTAAYLAAIGRQ